ncbi:20586_t:CDS:2 [Cetraspora pellucida]|uniref:20586_t:CDS:1 n=1 Tax=Cetraspora pellucida TaxID=1433469 RepID=A0A9N9GM25_9GLOM|nr:20586_t:CDS:2 [Cetraspora pellucida]
MEHLVFLEQIQLKVFLSESCSKGVDRKTEEYKYLYTVYYTNKLLL